LGVSYGEIVGIEPMNMGYNRMQLLSIQMSYLKIWDIIGDWCKTNEVMTMGICWGYNGDIKVESGFAESIIFDLSKGISRGNWQTIVNSLYLLGAS